jgi:acyl-CoA synthetase (AMP-forming)/AMP-acid ligase II
MSALREILRDGHRPTFHRGTPNRWSSEDRDQGSEAAQAAAGRRQPTFVDVLRARSAESGSRTAFTFLDGRGGSSSLTYGQLEERACRMAGELLARGLHGERVLVDCTDGPDAVIALFGCIYAGAVAVPVPPLGEADLTGVAAARLEGIVQDCSPRAGITAATTRESITGVASGVGHVRWLTMGDCRLRVRSHMAPVVSASDVAYLQYTSGSTSAPKGVVVTHANLVGFASQAERLFHPTEEWCWVGWLPLFHDMGLVSGVVFPVFSGYRSVLLPPRSFLNRPLTWLEAITEHRATITGAPNFAYELCARRVRATDMEGLSLASLRVARTGAEPVRWSTMERFADLFAPAGFRRETFCPSYGLAEATLSVCCAYGVDRRALHLSSADLERGRMREVAPDARGQTQTVVNCGPPLPDGEVVIVHAQRGVRLPEGQVGEIWASGPNIAAGYWERPDETAQTFDARLASGGDGGPFLRTGDLGFLSGGELFVTGRIKDVILVRGRNIYPQDLELTVERSSPAVRPGRVAAFQVEGDDGEAVALALELRPEAEVAAVDMITIVRRSVVRAHGIQPRAVYLLPGGSIPRTSSGKLARAACRSAIMSGDLPATLAWTAGAGPGFVP